MKNKIIILRVRKNKYRYFSGSWYLFEVGPVVVVIVW